MHRDMKPGNVMVTPSGRVKVLDFGLARHLPAAPAAETTPATTEFVTRHGIAGTVGYMAPEQIEGQPADARSDVFALGIIIFELLTGRRPFIGDTAWKTMQATVTTAAPEVSRLRPDTPPGARAHRLAGACAQARRSLRVGARALRSIWRRCARPPLTRPRGQSRRRAAIAAIAVLVLAAASAIGWAWRREARAQLGAHGRDAGDRAAGHGWRLRRRVRLARQALAIAPDDRSLQQAVAQRPRRTCRSRATHPALTWPCRAFSQSGTGSRSATTPIKSARVPFGSPQWRVTKAGYAAARSVRQRTGDVVDVASRAGGHGAAGQWSLFRGDRSSSTSAQADLPDYWIDMYEVTNRQFKQFVDAGGYRSRDYWHEPFVKDGRTIDWDDAIAEFHDATGPARALHLGRSAGIPTGRTTFPSAA